jgi:hypothetical protein
MTEVPCRAYVRLGSKSCRRPCSHAANRRRLVFLHHTFQHHRENTLTTHHGIAPSRALQKRVAGQGIRRVKRGTRTTNLILLVAPSSVDNALLLRLRLASMVAKIGMRKCGINQRL